MTNRVYKAVALSISALVTGSILTPITVHADQMVILTGTQVDFGDEVNTNPGSPFGVSAGYTIDDVCVAANDARLGMALGDMLGHMEAEIENSGSPITLSMIESMPGAPNRFQIEQDLANARDSFCNREDPPVVVNPFTITYSSCRMSMTTPTHALVINLPPDGSTATMLMADHPNQQVVHIELTSHINDVTDVLGSGWSEAVTMTSSGASQEFFGYETDHYDFSYTTGLGEAGLGALTEADVEAGAISSPQALGNLISVETEGEAWISATAPGVEIARSFYRNLASRVQPDQSTSFFGGMINNLVSMLDKGIPIIIDQTTRSKIMGRTSVSGYSESHVANIRLWDYGPEWCMRPVEAPADYEETTLEPGSPDMMSGSDGAASQDMAAAMQQASEAMQNMTPEQQQMMQEFGLTGMMEQAMGGANAATQPEGYASAAGASAAAGGGSAGSAMPPAEELNSGNLTESIQRHLQALGYDVGATDGEASLATTIAISTFQAEKGMEVTGEPTPQLLGILSAEVDSRR